MSINSTRKRLGWQHSSVKTQRTRWLSTPIGIRREFWGRGLATQALNRILHPVVDRPIFARAATDNIGSIRVLQKCGFKIIGSNKDFANGRGEEREEYILRLDPDQMSEAAVSVAG